MTLLDSLTDLGMRPSRFDTGGVEIAYSEGPDNGPPLLLVHGVTGRRDSFLPVLPALLERFHVFAMDHRGHGESGHATGHYKSGDYAADIAAMASGPAGGEAIVWGQSLGAATGIEAAARWPETIVALIAEDPPLRPRGATSQLFETFQRWYDLCRSGMSVEEMAAVLGGPSEQALGAAARYKAETLDRLDPDVLAHVLERRVWTGEVTELIREVRCPALLMQADPGVGGVIPDEVIADISPLPSNWQFKRFDGSGHKIHGDMPMEAVAEALEFLKAAGVADR